MPRGQQVLLLLVVTAQVSRGHVIPEHGHQIVRRANGIRQDSLKYHERASPAMCRAGTHRDTPDDGRGPSCTSCTDGKDYTEYPNDLKSCLSCTRCRDDQEEVSRCSPTRNTICRCKAGTFCPPDHPCEVCVRCKNSCPVGEVQINPCNATADDICASPTEPPATQGNVGWVITVAVVIVLLFLIGIVVCLCKNRRQDSKAGSSSSTSKVRVSLVRTDLKWCFNSSTQETVENELNSKNDPAAEPILPQGEGGPRTPSSTPMVLIPVDGEERRTLQRAFDVFVEEVNIKDWDYLMRTIGLLENEIQTAKCDYNGVKEQNYQMLRKWHDKTGDSASVNELLKAMRTGRLMKEADRIQDILLKKKLYNLSPRV